MGQEMQYIIAIRGNGVMCIIDFGLYVVIRTTTGQPTHAHTRTHTHIVTESDYLDNSLVHQEIPTAYLVQVKICVCAVVFLCFVVCVFS